MGVFMQKNKRKVGAFYEEIAADYLVSQGVMILERNYRNWLGEIDLIGMTADGWLIFVEVKYRSTEHSGNPLAAVDGRKQLVISKVAVEYLKNHYSVDDTIDNIDKVSKADVMQLTRKIKLQALYFLEGK